MNRRIKSTVCFVLLLVLGMNLQAQSSERKSKFNLNKSLLKEGYVKIQMEKLASGHLHISGKLNGVKGNFILDTGASGTVIEIKNEKKFQMKTQSSERQASGAGGSSIQMKASPKNNLTLGNLELKEKSLMLMNLDHVNQAFERFGIEKVDGVIGADILTSQKAIIDYANLCLYVRQ